MFKLAKLGVSVFFGDGSQELSFIYGPDLAEMLIRSVDADSAQRVFFASHPEIRTAREFSAEVFGALRGGKAGKKPLVLAIPAPLARVILSVTGSAATLAKRATLLTANKANEFLAEAWTCSSDAIVEATQWHPPTALVDGLSQTAAWYLKAKWL